MADRVGQIFGSYRLIRLLEQNELAEVYLGEHLRLPSQRAAVKILAARLQEEVAQAFMREVEHIALLLHPHIVRVQECEVTDGIPFLAMDYAEQGSLRQRHKRGEQVALPTIVSYIQSVADGLQYVHEQGIIHRAIKPDNMLIGARDEIVLSDFGIAALAHSIGPQSASATPYMAPEQFQGYVRFASDQYALGISVYEWLTGELPLVAPNQALLPRLSEKLPGIAPMVDRVVMTALEKNPHHRFASVRDFARALQLASRLPAAIPIPLYYEGPTAPKSVLQSNTVSNTSSDMVPENAEPDAEVPQEPDQSEVTPIIYEAPPDSNVDSTPIIAAEENADASAIVEIEEKVSPRSKRAFSHLLRNKWAVALAVLLLLLLLGGGGCLLFFLFYHGGTHPAASIMYTQMAL